MVWFQSLSFQVIHIHSRYNDNSSFQEKKTHVRKHLTLIKYEMTGDTVEKDTEAVDYFNIETEKDDYEGDDKILL